MARRGHPGEGNPMAKLTAAEVVELRRAYGAGGISLRALAVDAGVVHSTIQRAVRALTWASVLEGV